MCCSCNNFSLSLFIWSLKMLFGLSSSTEGYFESLEWFAFLETLIFLFYIRFSYILNRLISSALAFWIEKLCGSLSKWLEAAGLYLLEYFESIKVDTLLGEVTTSF